MMNINEIDREIERLENSDTTFSNVQKLSWLYTVKDHLGNDTIVQDSFPECTDGFSACMSMKPIEPILDILNEHFSIIAILYPKEYDSVIAKIKST